MASGYKAPKDGMAAVLEKFTRLERQVAALRQALGLESAVIGAGGIKIKNGGSLDVVDGGGVTIGAGGYFTTYGSLVAIDPQTLNPSVYFGTLLPTDFYRSGLLVADPVTQENMFWAAKMADGTSRVATSPNLDQVILSCKRMSLSASDGVLALYNLPAVSGPDYQLGYDFNGTDWSMCLITSSQKYKTPLEPLAAEDVAALLDVEVGTFRMLEDVERRGDDAKVRFGAIAEQVQEAGLGDLLVSHLDGEPEALKDNLVGWALVPLVREQRDEIAGLKQTVADQAATIADLTARLEALEARA